MQTYWYSPAVGTEKVKLRAASGGPAPGGALGGSVPVLNRSLALSFWGDGPGAAFWAAGDSGSWIGGCWLKKLAVWGAMELLTNVTLSPCFTAAGTGAKARMSVWGVEAPISTFHVVVPSRFLVDAGTADWSFWKASLPSASHWPFSWSPRVVTAAAVSPAWPAATTVIVPTIWGWITQA